MKLLQALKLQPYIDEVWGTSAGAGIALWLSCGVRADEVTAHLWNVYHQRFSFSFLPRRWSVVKQLASSYLLPERWHKPGFLGFMDPNESIGSYYRALKQDKIPAIPAYMISFNAHLFRKEVLTHTPIHHSIYGDKIRRVSDLVEAAIASSTVPILYKPYPIPGSAQRAGFLDGGLVENLPLKSIFDKWKIDRRHGLENRPKLIVLPVNLGSANFDPKRHFGRKYIRGKELHKLYNRMTEAALHEAHLDMLKNDPNTIVFPLNMPVDGFSMFTPKCGPEMLKVAKKYLTAVMPAIEEECALQLAEGYERSA